MTQVHISLTTRRRDYFSHVPSPVITAVAAVDGTCRDIARGVALAIVGLSIVLATTTGVLALSQWQGLAAPVLPAGQIQHR